MFFVLFFLCFCGIVSAEDRALFASGDSAANAIDLLDTSTLSNSNDTNDTDDIDITSPSSPSLSSSGAEKLLEVNSALAVEKEIAADTLGTICGAVGAHFLPFVEDSTVVLCELLAHYYEGIRKSAVDSLLEVVRCFYGISVGAASAGTGGNANANGAGGSGGSASNVNGVVGTSVSTNGGDVCHFL